MRPLEVLAPTETVEMNIDGLSLVPRMRFCFTIHPYRHPPTIPHLDVSLIRQNLILYFLETCFSEIGVSIIVDVTDITITPIKTTRKRNWDDPVAQGELIIRDLGFLNSGGNIIKYELEKKFVDMRMDIAKKLNAIEISLGEDIYDLWVEVPFSDDFERMRREWERFYASCNQGDSRGRRKEPDTIVLKGLPSLWFGDRRFSKLCRPSMQLTYGFFSMFGKLRNFEVVTEDDYMDGIGVVKELRCRITVQFEEYQDFYNALKLLCTRSLQKEGSGLRPVDYEITWDNQDPRLKCRICIIKMKD